MLKKIYLILNAISFYSSASSHVDVYQARRTVYRLLSCHYPVVEERYADTINHFLNTIVKKNQYKVRRCNGEEAYYVNQRIILRLITKKLNAYQKRINTAKRMPVPLTGQARVTTPCHHFFHRNCIKPALVYQELCPLCRSVLSKEQLEYVSPRNIEQDEMCAICQDHLVPQKGQITQHGLIYKKKKKSLRYTPF